MISLIFGGVRLLVAMAFIVAVATVSGEILYSRTRVPTGWTMGKSASPSAQINFIFALHQRNVDQLERIALSVSDPDDEAYQDFWDFNRIQHLVSPPKHEQDIVIQYARSHGVSAAGIYNYGDAIEVSTSVKAAAVMFNTSFFVFTHTISGHSLVRAFGSWSLPSEIRKYVKLIVGLSMFPKWDRRTSPNDDDNGVIVPQSVTHLYDLPRLVPGSHPEISVAVISYDLQFYNSSDVTVACNATEVVGCQAVAADHLVGYNDPLMPQLEGSLDIGMITLTNTESTLWYWIEDGDSGFYKFSLRILNATDAPQITTTSYAWWEDDWCSMAPECEQLGVDSYQYAELVNTNFAKVALKGITLIFASGDSGANGRTNEACRIPQLRPPFPASSPWVTAVGATELRNSTYNLTHPPHICNNSPYVCISDGIEAAVSPSVGGFSSGGGFSNITNAKRPIWQYDEVDGYLNSGIVLPPNSYYTRLGRGFPDVAIVGTSGVFGYAGHITADSGTSMSSPIFAAIIGLLAETYQNITGKPFGFLNPFLYKMHREAPMAFRDITIGDNICTEEGCFASCEGFYATKGWDPVTGLGVPNYPAMLAYTQMLANQVVARRSQSKQ